MTNRQRWETATPKCCSRLPTGASVTHTLHVQVGILGIRHMPGSPLTLDLYIPPKRHSSKSLAVHLQQLASPSPAAAVIPSPPAAIVSIPIPSSPPAAAVVFPTTNSHRPRHQRPPCSGIKHHQSPLTVWIRGGFCFCHQQTPSPAASKPCSPCRRHQTLSLRLFLFFAAPKCGNNVHTPTTSWETVASTWSHLQVLSFCSYFCRAPKR
jgi:hypothetical protein